MTGDDMKFNDAAGGFFIWFWVAFSIFIVAYLFVDGDVKYDYNYGAPLHLPLKDGEPVEVELVAREIMESKFKVRYEDIYLFRLNRETFECDCNAFWCRESVRQHQKVIRFRKVTVRFTDGTIRRRVLKGSRFCKIEQWEFWNPADEAVIRQWSEAGRKDNPYGF